MLFVIGILSGLEIFYTAYLLNEINHSVLLDRVHFLSKKQEIKDIQFLLAVSYGIFMSYLLIDNRDSRLCSWEGKS